MTSQQHSTFKISRFFLFKEIDRSCCTFPLGAIFNQSKHKLIVFNINHSFLSSISRQYLKTDNTQVRNSLLVRKKRKQL